MRGVADTCDRASTRDVTTGTPPLTGWSPEAFGPVAIIIVTVPPFQRRRRPTAVRRHRRVGHDAGTGHPGHGSRWLITRPIARLRTTGRVTTQIGQCNRRLFPGHQCAVGRYPVADAARNAIGVAIDGVWPLRTRRSPSVAWIVTRCSSLPTITRLEPAWDSERRST